MLVKRGNIMFDDHLYMGNIKICTEYKEKPLSVIQKNEYKSKLYKRDARLLKTINGGFVDIDNLNFYNYWKLRMDGAEFYGYNDLNMDIKPQEEGQLFVDEESIQLLAKNIFEEESFARVKKICR